MGKGTGIVITGIIFSIAGACLIGATAKAAYDDYKKYDKFIEKQHMVLNDSKKITLEVDGGCMNIHHTTEEHSYVDYKVLDFYTVKYDEEENELKLKRKWLWNLVFFTWTNIDDSVVDVYLTDTEYDAYLELNAGKLNVDEDFTFNSLTIDVSAGKFNSKGNITVNKALDIDVSAGDVNITGNIVTSGDTKIKVSAGDVNIKDIETKNIEVKISAGDIDIKRLTTNDISFKVSAGDLDMNVVGKKSDYTIDIDKSAGSCNVKDNDGGSKRLDGKISAGSATINFVD